MKSSPKPKTAGTAPRIQVIQTNLPELPSPGDGSKDNLLTESIPSPPYRGQDNPIFNFDSVSLFSRAPSRVSEISPAFDIPFRGLPPTRRGSYFPFLPAESKTNLAVPSLSATVQEREVESTESTQTTTEVWLVANSSFNRTNYLMKQQKPGKRSSFRMKISRRIRSGFLPVPRQDSDSDNRTAISSTQGAAGSSTRRDQLKPAKEQTAKKEKSGNQLAEISTREATDSHRLKQEAFKYHGKEAEQYDLTVDSRVELGFSFSKKRRSFGSESAKRRGERFQRQEIEKRKELTESDEGEMSSDSDSHVCDFYCPLITHGQCPNSKTARGKLKGQRRSSYTSSSPRDSAWISTTSSVSFLRPLASLSTDDIPGHDGRGWRTAGSPGLLSTASMWSTTDLRRSLGGLAKPEADTVSHVGTASLSNVSGSFSERMHELVRAFSSRTQKAKEKISQPPTPSSDSDYDAKSAVSATEEKQAPRNILLGSFMPMGSGGSDVLSDENHDHYVGVWHCKFKTPKFLKKFKFPSTMEPQSKVYVSWLLLVSLAFLYNAVVIPLRGVFPYQTSENVQYWLIIDYLCDFIYILDIVIFKCRLRFVNNGIIECNRIETKKHYMKKWMFKFDVMSLTPLDFFYFIKSVGVNPWLRLPRVLKIQTYWEFYERCDQASRSSAHTIRVIKTVTYMLFLIHVETCGYYAVSVYEGLGTNKWVYSGEGIAYIRCFYLATKTATSIGNNPTPTNQLEYIFMTFYWLSGVFVFALLIGQIRDIVEAAGLVKDNYRKKMDSCLWYMQSINLPKEMKDKVREWFLYNWEQQKTIDERSLVCSLPKKLQTDLAINVHFNTLSKVQLFQDCERNLLYDLVLKLKPILYLPGDFICKKGEVGREMYIVTQGQVEVVGGEDGETVLATLYEGSVFGEISLLAMSGRGNRRTADVRSKGYTNVFTLSKHDFEMAMTEYPDAQALLKRRAKKLLKANAKMEKKKKLAAEEIIKTPTETPKLVQTVIQVMDPNSNFVRHLNSSLMGSSINVRRPHSRSHSHKLSTSASNIHHLTPPRSHSFRLSSQPSNVSVDPSLNLDQPVGQTADGCDTDDEDDDAMFDDSSDDVSLSEILHDALTISSFGDDDDDDDDGEDDYHLLSERYEKHSEQGKRTWTDRSPHRPAESVDNNENPEEMKNMIQVETGHDDYVRNGSIYSRSLDTPLEDAILQFAHSVDPSASLQFADSVDSGASLQYADSVDSDLPVLHGAGPGDVKKNGADLFNNNRSNMSMNGGNISVRSCSQHTTNVADCEDETRHSHDGSAGVNSGTDLHKKDFLDKHSWHDNQEKTMITPSSSHDTVTVSTSKLECHQTHLTQGEQSVSSRDGVGGRVRKLSVVSPPVSPGSHRDTQKQMPLWGSGSLQVVTLKDNCSDLIMRSFTPVEIPPIRPIPSGDHIKSRISPDVNKAPPVLITSPSFTNGLEAHSGDNTLGDIPAENRVTFSVEVHRQKAVSSSTIGIHGHKETTL